MTITNILEMINPEEIIEISYHTFEEYYFLDVHLTGNRKVKLPLQTGFQIHQCNEFLRSLNLRCAEFIEYRGFEGGLGYIELIKNCSALFQIRKVMEAVTGMEYSQIDVTAEQVRSCMLDRLSTKHKRNVLTEAHQTNTLDKYVAEALTYFK